MSGGCQASSLELCSWVMMCHGLCFTRSHSYSGSRILSKKELLQHKWVNWRTISSQVCPTTVNEDGEEFQNLILGKSWKERTRDCYKEWGGGETSMGPMSLKAPFSLTILWWAPKKHEFLSFFILEVNIDNLDTKNSTKSSNFTFFPTSAGIAEMAEYRQCK